MRIYFIVVLFIAFPTLAKSDGYPITKVISFLNKAKPCRIAIGVNALPEFELRHSKDPTVTSKAFGLGSDWMNDFNNNIGLPKIMSVLCIQDLVVNAGTINELQGCTLALYSVDSGSYEHVYQSSSKLCDKGGFKDLEAKTLKIANEYKQYFASAEQRTPVKIFDMKLFTILWPGNKNIENIFLPHLYKYQKTPTETINRWKKWVSEEKAISDLQQRKSEELIQNKYREEEKIQEKKKAKAKKLESLYE